MSLRAKIITITLLIPALLGTVIWLFRSGPQAPEMRDFYGRILEIERVGDDLALSVDEVEFLSGEEAVIKGMIDTGCSRGEIEDCIPSLNNDFYIRNPDPSVRKYTLSPSSRMTILESPGGPTQVSSTISQFELHYRDSGNLMNKLPFLLRSESDTVVSLEQQYLP
jgi:hypothetical protein